MKVKNHRFEGVEFVPTKKHGGVLAPKGIVFHYTAGWTTEGDVNTLAKSDRQVSAHLVLGRDGKWVQILPFNVKGWHAGPSRFPLVGTAKFRNLNDDFIGIEICNQGWLKKLSTGQFQAAAGTIIEPNGKFQKSTRTTSKENPPPSKWPQFGHPNLGSGEFVWEPYPAKQLDALEDGVLALIEAYPNMKTFVGHDEIDTRGWKTDPGPLFPMRRMRTLLEKRGGPELDADAMREVLNEQEAQRQAMEERLREVARERAAAKAPVKLKPLPPPASEQPWYSRWDNLSRWWNGTK